MADNPIWKSAPEVAPLPGPTGRPGLPPSQSHLSLDIEWAAAEGRSDVAYSMFEDAYSQLLARSPQRAASLLKGVESQLDHVIEPNHLNDRLAAQWGLERLASDPLDAKIIKSDLTDIVSDKTQDPFDRAMASELKKDLAVINPEPEGGFLGFGTHPAESVSKLDLERYIDYTDHHQQTIDMGTGLLRGNYSVFDQVARSAHKNPNDPEQPLTLEDFKHFEATIMQGEDDRLVRQVINRWALTSVNALAEHFDGDAFLTKQSIRRALSAIDDAGQTQQFRHQN